MKRRNFIFCTALSVGSLSSAFASADNQSSSSVETNFKQYLSAIEAQGELTFFCDDQLNTQCTANSAPYLKTGYKPYGSRYYFCADRTVAICPLVLSPDDTGVIDISVLFFRKDKADNWIFCNSFSGFHLESIVRALPRLDQNYSTVQLTDLLVPAYTLPAERLPYTIFTKSGAMSLVVKIEDQKTTIDFKLTERHRDICLIKEPSSHSLTYNSLV